jgi:hypothetical protein
LGGDGRGRERDMANESSQDRRPEDDELERWGEVARGDTAPLEDPSAWGELFEPLDAEQADRIVEGALGRARAHEPADSTVSRLSRRSIGWTIAAVVAAAAVLVIVLRTPSPAHGSVGGFDIEMRGRAELRSATAGTPELDPYAPIELRLRNETNWIIRPVHATAWLYLVVQEPGRAPRLLDASIEAQHGAFRVLGEVGALGLVPGEATVYFVNGPRNAEGEAVRVAQGLIEGLAPPPGWSIDSRRVHVSK